MAIFGKKGLIRKGEQAYRKWQNRRTNIQVEAMKRKGILLAAKIKAERKQASLSALQKKSGNKGVLGGTMEKLFGPSKPISETGAGQLLGMNGTNDSKEKRDKFFKDFLR